MSYRQITEFAGNINNISNDPLTYCVPDFLNSQFLHGADGRIFGKFNRNCAIFMSNRCSQNWDGICEAMSQSTDANYPDMTNNTDGTCRMTAGDILVKNTAYVKYLYNANDQNVICEPFNPNAADSPTICYISQDSCAVGDGRTTNCGVLNSSKQVVQPDTCPRSGMAVRQYGLTHEQIKNLDNDAIMHKLIDNPQIAPDLLHMIYHNARQRGILHLLQGKRLGFLYEMNNYPLK